MKKIARILALVSLMALCFSSLTVNAAPPKIEDYFPQTPAISEDNKVKSSIDAFFVGINEITEPVGQWSWTEVYTDKPGCWPIYRNINPLDCNLKTLVTSYSTEDFKGATHISQIVFADYYTQTGQGEGGRHKPEQKKEDFEQLTLIYGLDATNWKSVDFTVAYHTEQSTFVDNQEAEHPIDTYWHLIFDEPIPVSEIVWFGFHSAEDKAWDAQDHITTLGIVIHADYTYLVADDGTAPELTYPETEGETTAADTTVEEDTTAGDTTAADTTVSDDTTAAGTTAEGGAAGSDGGNGLWIALAIGGGVVILAVIITVAVKKKK